MGNTLPHPPTSTDADDTASTASDDDDDRSCHNHGYYKGMMYEPSQQQVDLVYAELVVAYTKVLADFRRRGWYGFDEEILLLKLLSKFRQEHPKLFLPSPPTDDDQGEGSVVVSKKKKVEGSGLVTFQGSLIPKEVVASFLPYCDRSTINNFSLTCRGVYQTIYHDRKVVESIPWPIHRPWPTTGWDSQEVGIIISRDMTRFAIVRKQWAGDPDPDDDDDDERDEDDDYTEYHHCEIWDRFNGLIGELEWRDSWHNPIKPVFSPDGQLFLAPLIVVEEVAGEVGRGWAFTPIGVQAVYLPTGTERRPIIVSEHPFGSIQAPVSSVAFASNDTIAIIINSDNDNFGVDLWNIDRGNGQISFSFSHTILEDLLYQRAEELTTFLSESKTFLIIRPDYSQNRIIFYDPTQNESFSKCLLPVVEGQVYDMKFSYTGKLVVTVRDWQRSRISNNGHICIFDCAEVNRVDEIGKPRVICPHNGGEYVDILDFSADGTKVAVTFRPRLSLLENHIIDLQNGEVVSEIFLDDDDWDHLAWNVFANCCAYK